MDFFQSGFAAVDPAAQGCSTRFHMVQMKELTWGCAGSICGMYVGFGLWWWCAHVDGAGFHSFCELIEFATVEFFHFFDGFDHFCGGG